MSPELFWDLVWKSFDEQFKHYLNQRWHDERQWRLYYQLGA